MTQSIRIDGTILAENRSCPPMRTILSTLHTQTCLLKRQNKIYQINVSLYFHIMSS
jgi:hypothetical protein